MFSQTAEYALRAVVWMASSPEDSLTTKAMAKHTHVPAGYLSKVLQSLVRAGLVDSRRGLHGGYSLTREPADLTVLEVINAVDPIRRICVCPLQLESHRDRLCAMHRRLDEAIASIEETLGNSTIAELLADPAGVHPMRES